MAAPHKKDFLDTNDFTKEELLDMIELSRAMKGYDQGRGLPAHFEAPALSA